MHILARSVTSCVCIVAIAVLTACAPVVRTVIPDITGSITNGGAVVSNAEVTIGQGPDAVCRHPKRRVLGNIRGDFAVKLLRELGVAYAAAEEFTDWNLCIRAGERIYHGVWFFGHSSKAVIHVQCDLQRETTEPQDGVCVIRE